MSDDENRNKKVTITKQIEQINAQLRAYGRETVAGLMRPHWQKESYAHLQVGAHNIFHPAYFCIF